MRVMSSLLGAAALTLILLVGCSGTSPVLFVDEGNRYSLAQITELLEAQKPGPEVTLPDDVSRRRTEALAALRRQGETGNDAADMITASFPADTRGVPFYVERATVDGRGAWLLVEAIGPTGGKLVDRRIWVLDDEGAVVFSATR